ncbi:AAA family ATPase [Allorhizocola rhizosphaerae]|uniref:AAA family ATPase n=1 Tax=Allorhizocola rhizosphaerae TaxID=1872709 RepID=UPI001B8AD510
MIIDEIQLAPGLLRPINLAVDLDPRLGRFLLTGSGRVLALRQLPDAMPRRMEIIELWPFSHGEIGGEPDRLVDAVFAHGADLEHTARLGEPGGVACGGCTHRVTAPARPTTEGAVWAPAEMGRASGAPASAAWKVACSGRAGAGRGGPRVGWAHPAAA